MPFSPPVQTTRGSNASLPWTMAFGSNVTAGNLIVVAGSNTGSGHVSSGVPTDSLGNTYIHAFGQNDISGAGIDFWYAVSGSSGACTITFPNGISNMSLIAVAAEYHIAGITLDQTAGTTNANVAYGVTTTHASELIIACCTSGLQPTTWTITGGFVNEIQDDATPLQPCSIVLADLSVSSIGTYQTTFTGSPSFSANGIMISFSGTSIVVNCNNPPNGLVGVPYTTTFTASGGTAPYTFTISAGSLPPGLTLASTGVVTGVPTTAGLYSFTVQATDANSNTGTVVCTINILNTSTLRFEIPQKRWFPHAYGDNIVMHYLDETYLGSVNSEQLLMLSSTLGFIYRSGGNTDNGLAILSAAITPSLDGGLIRLQKLYVDVMTDLDGTGTLVANMQFNNQTINGTSVSYTTSGTRGIQLQNISSLSFLNLYRNASVAYTWTGGPAGPRIYRSEVAGYVQPYISTFWVTQFINLAFPGWKHHRRLYAGYISNNTLLFTIKTQDGRTYGPYTLPSTSGQFKIIPLMLDQDIKDLAFAYQINGQGNNFVLFPESWTIETKEWTEPSYLPLAIFNT